MRKLGIDIGASTVKIVILENNGLVFRFCEKHYGKIAKTLGAGLEKIRGEKPLPAAVTGSECGSLAAILPTMETIEEIPALVSGVKILRPDAGSVMEIGSQSSVFVTDLQKRVPRFAVNEHCAGGTGSFFEAQMARLGMQIEDFSETAEKANSIPTISGRCAVFAKTDIIHRQQEGVSKEDILLGLCYAMIKNYRAVIVRSLPVEKPVVLCGGIAKNTGVAKAVRSVFSLSGDDLIIPENAVYAGACGAAATAEKTVSVESLLAALEAAKGKTQRAHALNRLVLKEGVVLKDPEPSLKMPAQGAYLGIDIGSTSTNLVLTAREGTLIDYLYLRTAGEPEKVCRQGLKTFQSRYGDFTVLGCGITGSGRERLGRLMGADTIRDEITAQAKAAAYFFPDADTVFEIGGQDSKYISLKDGKVADFQMNKICAAGTGSFVEEQAARMGIPIGDFGPLALQGENPCDLGERCTVFIESQIAQAEAQGVPAADIAAGVCHSVVKNYLHKVVGGKPVGKKIVLQGGVDYNPGIVAAFQDSHPDVVVNPVFSISGAFGAAVLARETVGENASKFRGVDFPAVLPKPDEGGKTAQAGIVPSEIPGGTGGKTPGTAAQSGPKGGPEGPDGAGGRMPKQPPIDPNKKTVGVPRSLIMFKFFLLVKEFFLNLGFNVVLSNPSHEDTVEMAQESACGETCYPVKLIYGHMRQLAKMKVDYIFFPSIRSIKHPHAHAAHNYSCPYMQTAARAVFDTLGLEKQGIKLLCPLFDLDMGEQMMAKSMLEVGKSLGFGKLKCIPGMMKGAQAVKSATQNLEEIGQRTLSNLKKEDRVIVLISRNYNLQDPVLNMGIPQILAERGCKVLSLVHLPALSLDISKDYPNMYWPFGDHILAGAKIIKNHPNLYALYITNHGCGPDTMLSHLFREIMGDKPYLQIEADEHFSRVGVITRIEAFLNTIGAQPDRGIPPLFNILDVPVRKINLFSRPVEGKKLLLPDLGLYTKYLAEYFRRQGFEAESLPKYTREMYTKGRAEMNSKEYLPFVMTVGACLAAIEKNGGDKDLQFLLPFGYGADADGQYARVLRAILDRKGYTECAVISPMTEEIPEKAPDFDKLMRAILTGDVLYAIPYDKRSELAPEKIPDILELTELAKYAGGEKKGRRIAVAGDIFCLTSLDEGVFEKIEQEGDTVVRAPFSEMLQFLWKDNKKKIPSNYTETIRKLMKQAGIFADSTEHLMKTADSTLGPYEGNNGRYRYAKLVDFGETADAVLSAAPRYENTEVSLQLRGVEADCKAPLYFLTFDGDWDDACMNRLRSFLYYC